MSRVGKLPIIIPREVDISVAPYKSITVNGPKGKLFFAIPNDIDILYDDNAKHVIVSPASSTKELRALWGLCRSMIYNMVQGVSSGFTRLLEITGVGYKASCSKNFLVLSLGYSHDIIYALPEGVTAKCEKPTSILLSGCDKQLVGQVAAEIRSFRKPEPYKGKGIKYSDEVIRRKVGKKK